MKTWRAKSWSKQARNMSDGYIKWVHLGAISYEDAKEMIFNSYRSPVIKQRALKRLNLWKRKGKL